MSDTNLYIPVITLSNQDNAKLLRQLKSGFKPTVNWNKYQPKTTELDTPNGYLEFLIDPDFYGVNRFFVLAFNAIDNRKGHSRCYLPTAKVEDCNVMIDEKNFLINQLKVIVNMIILEKLQLVTQLVVCYIKIISKNILK